MVIPAIGLMGKDNGKLVWAVKYPGGGDIHIYREGEMQVYCGFKPSIVIAALETPTCEKCKKKAEKNGLA